MSAARHSSRAGAVTLCLVTAAAGALSTPAADAASHADLRNSVTNPNVIMILADDLGYDQISLNGGPIATPNIDRIADDGVRFTDGYVAAPVCTPSRQAVMTGRHPSRIGGHSNRLARDRPERLPKPTVGNILKDRGYTTHAVGKWDLGGFAPRWSGDDVTLPNDAGFDSFYGSLRGMEQYCEGKGTVWRDDGAGHYESFPNTKYMTEEYTDNAEQFVQDQQDKTDPFFLYLSYTAPHAPIQSPDTCPDKDVSPPTFRSMVEIMDNGIGRVLDALGGKADNTMVVFVSDHGSQYPEFFPTALRGGKHTLFEGGLRVPFAMRWPAGLAHAPGGYSEMVSTLDLLPTIAAATGDGVSGYPGKNLISYLNGGRPGVPHQQLYWRHVADKPKASIQGTVDLAIRSGDHKYLRAIDLDGAAHEYLFDLSKDVGESDNLADDPDHAAVRARLISEHNAWNERNPLHEDFAHPRPAHQPRGGKPDGFLSYGGSWEVVDVSGDNQYRGVPEGGAGRVMFPGAWYEDVAVTADVRLAEPGQAGLVVRGASAAAAPYQLTGYQVRLVSPASAAEPQRLVLSRMADGERVDVRALERDVTPGVTYRLQVKAVGGDITVSVNDERQFHWADDTPLTGGGLGLTVDGAAGFFDRLSAHRTPERT